MDDDQRKRQYGNLLVAATAMSAVAHIVMQRFMREHPAEPELEEMVALFTKKLKNASIEGLDYDQQEALIRRSLEEGFDFFEIYRKKIRAAKAKDQM